MKKNLLFAILLITTFPLFSQLSNFDLGSYKTTDYKNKGLFLIFDHSGSFGEEDGKSFSGQEFSKTSYKTTLNGKANYFANLNNRKFQTSYNASLETNPTLQFWSRYDGDEKYKQSILQTKLFLAYNTKYYYKNERHLDIGANNYFTMGNNIKHTEISGKDTKFVSNNLSNRASIHLYHGHGRIENVSDAWKAYNIYEELTKQGLLSNNTISDEDISSLANLLTQLSTTRYYDSRIKSMDDIRSVFNHLGDKISDNTLEAILTVRDQYYYSTHRNSYRGSGKRLYYGINTQLTNNWKKESDKIIKMNANNIHLVVGYDNFKPINMKWQRDYSISLGIGKSDISDNISTNYELAPAFKFSLGYYINSRSSWINSFRVNTTHLFSDKDIDLVHSKFNTAISSIYTYYFSPRVQYFAHVNMAYNTYNTHIVENHLNTYNLSYNTGINYAIF